MVYRIRFVWLTAISRIDATFRASIPDVRVWCMLLARYADPFAPGTNRAIADDNGFPSSQLPTLGNRCGPAARRGSVHFKAQTKGGALMGWSVTKRGTCIVCNRQYIWGDRNGKTCSNACRQRPFRCLKKIEAAFERSMQNADQSVTAAAPPVTRRRERKKGR